MRRQFVSSWARARSLSSRRAQRRGSRVRLDGAEDTAQARVGELAAAGRGIRGACCQNPHEAFCSASDSAGSVAYFAERAAFFFAAAHRRRPSWAAFDCNHEIGPPSRQLDSDQRSMAAPWHCNWWCKTSNKRRPGRPGNSPRSVNAQKRRDPAGRLVLRLMLASRLQNANS